LELHAPQIYCIVMFQEGASLVKDGLPIGASTVGGIHFTAEKTHFRPFGALPPLLNFRHWFMFKEAVP
jgi:hypothetical protein